MRPATPGPGELARLARPTALLGWCAASVLLPQVIGPQAMVAGNNVSWDEMVAHSALVLAFGRMVAGLLFGVTPADSVTLIGAAVILGAVAMVATYLPARHATKIDPLVALRAQP